MDLTNLTTFQSDSQFFSIDHLIQNFSFQLCKMLVLDHNQIQGNFPNIELELTAQNSA